jgi:hypothetical protein
LWLSSKVVDRGLGHQTEGDKDLISRATEEFPTRDPVLVGE